MTLHPQCSANYPDGMVLLPFHICTSVVRQQLHGTSESTLFKTNIILEPFINPRCACAARVTVLALCVCVSVCARGGHSGTVRYRGQDAVKRSKLLFSAGQAVKGVDGS